MAPLKEFFFLAYSSPIDSFVHVWNTFSLFTLNYPILSPFHLLLSPFFLPTCAPSFMSLCVFGPLSLTRAAWKSRGGGYLLEHGQWTWLVHWRKWCPKWALASSSNAMSTNILVDKWASTLSSFFLFLYLYQNKATWCSCFAIRDLLLWNPYQYIINVMSSWLKIYFLWQEIMKVLILDGH